MNLKSLSKASDLFLAVAAYQQLAEQIDCPLHIGITEAGGMRAGTVKSSIGLGNLLWAGIGDTIACPYQQTLPKKCAWHMRC